MSPWPEMQLWPSGLLAGKGDRECEARQRCLADFLSALAIAFTLTQACYVSSHIAREDPYLVDAQPDAEGMRWEFGGRIVHAHSPSPGKLHLHCRGSSLLRRGASVSADILVSKNVSCFT